MGKMAKVPRGAAFVPVKPLKKKGDVKAKPVTNKVVFFGGKKAVMFGKKQEEEVKEAEPEMRVFNIISKKAFNSARYRMWKYSEVMQLDGDIRKGLKDEEKRRNKSKNILKRAARDALKFKEAGPLNRAISDYGNEKHLGYAYKALAKLEKITSPTVYTLASIVNACVRCGDVKEALKYVNEAEEKWQVKPNEVVLTAMMKGLCGDGLQKEASALLLKMHSKWGAMPNERMAATLLRGCMRNTDGRSVVLTVAKLDEIGFDVRHNKPAMEYLVKAMAADGMVKEAAKYLISGQVNQAACVALATSCVLLNETDLAKAALASAKALGTTSLGFEDKGNRAASAAMFNRLRDKEVAAEIERLENVLDGVTELSPLPDGVTKYKEDPTVVMLPQKVLDIKAKFAKPDLPLKIEVCSGHGEWVVERAASERDKANWVGIEIRPDRVYHAWTRRKLLGKDEEPTDNLVLVCGDAREALRLLEGVGAHELFINYPEPPGWMDSKYNLLDDDFFKAAHKCLLVGGAITMMSDHALYSAHTALRLVRLSREGLCYSSLSGDGLPVSTDVPQDYGSSYFDRMWLNGKRSKRFFIHFVKPTDAIGEELRAITARCGADDAPEAVSDDDDDENEDPVQPAPKRRKVVYL